MKTIEELFTELKQKIAEKNPESRTVQEVDKGLHFIGKKVLEEAGEVWLAAEYQGKENCAEEISQCIYHLLVMAIARDISLEDIYRYL
jgi:phosphoribosyl-ATP pyrophosphohydrolase